MFYRGQKVVCVNDTFNRLWTGDDLTANRPVKNGIYTVRWIGIWTFIGGSDPAILLVEIVNPPAPLYWQENKDHGSMEHPFFVGRFRPLVERKTDISVFRKMLVPKRATEDA